MSTHGCACKRLDDIESQMIRLIALISQRREELRTIRSEVLLAAPLKPDSIDAESGVVKLAELEKQAILRAVRLKGAQVAADLLGIGKTTLYRKLHDYGWDTKAVNALDEVAS